MSTYDEREDPSVRFHHFAVCLTAYAVFFVLGVTVETPEDIAWYWYLLLPPLFWGGFAMQILPYIYLKNILIRGGRKDADRKACQLWLTFLAAYYVMFHLFVVR